jgi:hypothetical protein
VLQLLETVVRAAKGFQEKGRHLAQEHQEHLKLKAHYLT